MDIIGDAIFAIWNAPELQPDHQERMLNAALMFQKNVKQFNGKQGSFALQTRVGLHTGEVVVGNVSSTLVSSCLFKPSNREARFTLSPMAA